MCTRTAWSWVIFMMSFLAGSRKQGGTELSVFRVFAAVSWRTFALVRSHVQVLPLSDLCAAFPSHRPSIRVRCAADRLALALSLFPGTKTVIATRPQRERTDVLH